MLITLSFNFKTQFFAAVDAYVPLTHLLCVGMIYWFIVDCQQIQVLEIVIMALY